jgi:hypothetical protein
MKFTRHARRREAKRQRKAAAAVERQFTTMMCDGAENRSDEVSPPQVVLVFVSALSGVGVEARERALVAATHAVTLRFESS